MHTAAFKLGTYINIGTRVKFGCPNIFHIAVDKEMVWNALVSPISFKLLVDVDSVFVESIWNALLSPVRVKRSPS